MKKTDVVKKEQQLSNSCRIQSIKIWSQRKKPFPNKKPQNQFIRGEITFGIQLQTFPSKCKTRNLQSKTWNRAEKTHSNNGSNYTHQYNQVKRSFNQFPSFMSEPYLSTKSKTCMLLKKFKVFSSLRRPETHFRRAQGHQGAGAITGSINSFQSSTITLNEAEYQKTVNTKLGKQTIWFSEVIKKFHHYFREE